MQLFSNFITISNIAARYRLEMGVLLNGKSKEEEEETESLQTPKTCERTDTVWSQYRAKFYSYRFWLLSAFSQPLNINT